MSIRYMYMYGQEARWPALAVPPGRGIYLISRIGEAATDAALSAERMRSALLSGASAPAVLQQTVSGSGTEVVPVESPATISRNGSGPSQTQRPKPAIPGADQTLKPTEPKAVNESARVITQEDFFRAHVRPAGLLRALRPPAAKSLPALLLCVVPARAGASSGPGAALETSTHLICTY